MKLKQTIRQQTLNGVMRNITAIMEQGTKGWVKMFLFH